MSFYNVKNGDTFTQIYDEKELSKIVFDSIEYYKTRADELMKDNKELRERAYEIVEEELKNKIKKLEEQLEMSYIEFYSKKEKELYDEFAKAHEYERLERKINGGKVPYLIPYYNGIGRNLTVVCPICGEKKDITDVEVW